MKTSERWTWWWVTLMVANCVFWLWLATVHPGPVFR